MEFFGRGHFLVPLICNTALFMVSNLSKYLTRNSTRFVTLIIYIFIVGCSLSSLIFLVQFEHKFFYYVKYFMKLFVCIFYILVLYLLSKMQFSVQIYYSKAVKCEVGLRSTSISLRSYEQPLGKQNFYSETRFSVPQKMPFFLWYLSE